MNEETAVWLALAVSGIIIGTAFVIAQLFPRNHAPYRRTPNSEFGFLICDTCGMQIPYHDRISSEALLPIFSRHASKCYGNFK